jgi:hypothetical protein
MSLGGSLKATIENSMGTLGGAVYAGAIAALVLCNGKICRPARGHGRPVSAVGNGSPLAP